MQIANLREIQTQQGMQQESQNKCLTYHPCPFNSWQHQSRVMLQEQEWEYSHNDLKKMRAYWECGS